MKKSKIIIISFYLISVISFIGYLIQRNNEKIDTHNQKVIVTGKDKFTERQTYIFACHPLDSEKINDFADYPDFCVYNKVKVGDTIITDIPLYSCRNQPNFNSDAYFIISVICCLIGLIANFVYLTKRVYGEIFNY